MSHVVIARHVLGVAVMLVARTCLLETDLLDWLIAHDVLMWWLTAGSVVMFVGTLVVMPMLVARLPADYFTRRPVRDWPARRPWVHVLLVTGKNVLGAVLLVAGLAMLVLPGQGLLTMVVGVLLLDFPGKRRLQGWLIRRGPVFRAANWVRRRRGKGPFELP